MGGSGLRSQGRGCRWHVPKPVVIGGEGWTLAFSPNRRDLIKDGRVSLVQYPTAGRLSSQAPRGK